MRIGPLPRAGVAIVDDLTARAWQGGKLACRPLQKAPVYRAYAVHNANFPPSVLAQAFVEGIQTAFKALRKTAAA